MKGRIAALLGLLLGLAAIALIVVRVGPASVWRGIASIGWGFALLLAYRLALIGLMGASWRVLDADRRAGVFRFAWARLIRDSASECLPLSQVGGFVLGGRALVVAGVPWVWATASTIVDVTLELVAQIAYLAFGLFLLWRLRPDLPLLRSVAVGLALLSAGAFAFAWLQARGNRLTERAIGRLLRSWSGARTGAHAVVGALADIHHERRRTAACAAMHLVDWLGNGAELYVALRLMHHAIALRDAFVIDSLLYGIRSFAFAVPNALGVQEAAYVVLGTLFGLPSSISLALSLIRRARDIVIGLPALATWQAVEGRKAWRAT